MTTVTLNKLDAYVREKADDLKSIGIATGNIVDVKINTRATRRLGLCRKEPDGYVIEISKFILNDINTLENTVYHELLHTVEGCMNHGSKWKSLAEKVNKVYNINISRTSAATDDMKQEYINKIKYKATCQGCGQEILRQKKSRFIAEIERYNCGRCGSKFKVEVL